MNLELIAIDKAIEIYQIIMAFANIVIYFFCALCIYRFLKIIEKTTYTWVLWYLFGISVFFVLIFSYISINSIMGISVTPSGLGTLLLRPAVFIMGCGIFSLFKIIKTMKKTGGTTWILRKTHKH